MDNDARPHTRAGAAETTCAWLVEGLRIAV